MITNKKLTFEQIFTIPKHITDELDNPDWKSYEKVHNWRNYVDEDIQKIWDVLTKNERIIIAHYAWVRAENEDWD